MSQQPLEYKHLNTSSHPNISILIVKHSDSKNLALVKYLHVMST